MRHARVRSTTRTTTRPLWAALITASLLLTGTGSAVADLPEEEPAAVLSTQAEQEDAPADQTTMRADDGSAPVAAGAAPEAEDEPAPAPRARAEEPNASDDGDAPDQPAAPVTEEAAEASEASEEHPADPASTHTEDAAAGSTGESDEVVVTDDQDGATEGNREQAGTDDDGADPGDQPAGGTTITPFSTIDSATGNWRYWMTNSSPGRGGSVEPEQTITYNLGADRPAFGGTVRDAQAYLTLTDDVGGALLDHVTLQSGSGPGEMTVDGSVGTWTLPDLTTSLSSRQGTFTAEIGEDAPDGATLTATITGNGGGSLRGSGLGASRYGTVSHTVDRNISEITVRTGTVRTGTGANDVAAAHTEGVRFALFAEQNDTDPIDEEWAVCTTDGSGDCVFTDVETTSGQTLWVGPIDAEPGSEADGRHVPIETLTTGSGSNFNDRTYRFQTPALNGGTYTLPSAGGSGWSASSGYVANRLANPTLPQTCAGGLSVAMVMDLSGSVAPHRDTYRDAAQGFVSALSGTGSSVALFSFGDASPRAGTSNQVAPLSVDDNLDTLHSRIDTYRNNMVTNQGTNWDAGMWAAAQGAGAHDYDLVVVLTDGNTTYSMPGTTGTGRDTTIRELERAVFSANAVKNAGTRVVSVGIGDDLSDHNLAAISGPAGYEDGAGLNEADYFNTGWDNLEAALEDFADGITCRASLTVTKMAEPYAGTSAPAAGWDFTAERTGGEGTVSPGDAQTTGEDGTAEFTVEFGRIDATASIRLAEQIRDDQAAAGWRLNDEVTCIINDGQEATLTVDDGDGVTIDGIGVGDQVQCTFTNVQSLVPGIELVKRAWDTATGPVDPDNPGSVEEIQDGNDVAAGTTITWTYTVTNTGQTPLENVEVSDDQGVAVSCPDEELDVGDSMTCWGSGTVTAIDP